MSGELATQTPPWPTAIPEGMLRPSAKTVNLSALPSPSVSSRTLTRSRPGPGRRRGYSRLSVIQIRPRSSKVMATGLTMSGSAATSSTRKPGGHGHRPDRLGRRSRRVGRPVLAVGDRSRPARSGPGRRRPRCRPEPISDARQRCSDHRRQRMATIHRRFLVRIPGRVQDDLSDRIRSPRSIDRVRSGRVAREADRWPPDGSAARGLGGVVGGSSSSRRCRALGSTGLTM